MCMLTFEGWQGSLSLSALAGLLQCGIDGVTGQDVWRNKQDLSIIIPKDCTQDLGGSCQYQDTRVQNLRNFCAPRTSGGSKIQTKTRLAICFLISQTHVNLCCYFLSFSLSLAYVCSAELVLTSSPLILK